MHALKGMPIFDYRFFPRKVKHPKVSWADLLQLASAEAVAHMGGNISSSRGKQVLAFDAEVPLCVACPPSCSTLRDCTPCAVRFLACSQRDTKNSALFCFCRTTECLLRYYNIRLHSVQDDPKAQSSALLTSRSFRLLNVDSFTSE